MSYTLRDRWNELPAEEYDGNPVCNYADDDWFWSLEDIVCFCDNNEIDPADLMLVKGVRQRWPDVHGIIQERFGCEDEVSLPRDVEDALTVLEDAMRENECPAWEPRSIRITLPGSVLADIRRQIAAPNGGGA